MRENLTNAYQGFVSKIEVSQNYRNVDQSLINMLIKVSDRADSIVRNSLDVQISLTSPMIISKISWNVIFMPKSSQRVGNRLVSPFHNPCELGDRRHVRADRRRLRGARKAIWVEVVPQRVSASGGRHVRVRVSKISI